jgi:hypothetical protein
MFHDITEKEIKKTFKTIILRLQNVTFTSPVQARLTEYLDSILRCLKTKSIEPRLVDYAAILVDLKRYFNTNMISNAVDDSTHNWLLDQVVYLRGSVIHPKYTLLSKWRTVDKFNLHLDSDTLNYIAEVLDRLNTARPICLIAGSKFLSSIDLKFMLTLKDLTRAEIEACLQDKFLFYIKKYKGV